MIKTEQLTIAVPDVATVSACLTAPAKPLALFVMAHGAGAGMHHSFMEAVASGLVERSIATLRYHFPAMQAGSRRPDRPSVAHATVRAAVAASARLQPGVPLLAGGKSFGARMTTPAQADQPLPRVIGLVAFGFPLHPAGKPSVDRATHLADVTLPMLFLQGDRDALANNGLVTSVVADLGSWATLHMLAGADHSLQVPARFGRTDPQVLGEALDVMAGWVSAIVTAAKAPG